MAALEVGARSRALSFIFFVGRCCNVSTSKNTIFVGELCNPSASEMVFSKVVLLTILVKSN